MQSLVTDTLLYPDVVQQSQLVRRVQDARQGQKQLCHRRALLEALERAVVFNTGGAPPPPSPCERREEWGPSSLLNYVCKRRDGHNAQRLLVYVQRQFFGVGFGEECIHPVPEGGADRLLHPSFDAHP